MKRTGNLFATALVTCAFALCLAGCFTSTVDPRTAGLAVDVSGQLKVDVKVGEPIEGEASIDSLLCFIPLARPTDFADPVTTTYAGIYGIPGLAFSATEQVRAGARYDALTKSGADVIVAPRYTVSFEDYILYCSVTAKVTGYKGTTSVPYQKP